MHSWLSRLRHDLVKRAVWAARDVRDASREPLAADLAQLRRGLFDLRDGEGRTVDAAALWERFRAESPGIPASALDAFGAAIADAQRALSRPSGDWRGALEAVLRIETAFADLARTLEEE
jgi:hypothetical protein